MLLCGPRTTKNLQYYKFCSILARFLANCGLQNFFFYYIAAHGAFLLRSIWVWDPCSIELFNFIKSVEDILYQRFPNFSGARTTWNILVLLEAQNIDLDRDWRTTWANLVDHQWSTLGITVLYTTSMELVLQLTYSSFL